MTQYVGLDVSLRETKLHVLDEVGNRVWRGRCATEPAAIAAAVRQYAPTALRLWGLMLWKRLGFKRAAIALARKMAVVLHAMWKSGTPFKPTLGAASSK